MAVHDNRGNEQEFEQLFAAYTNRDLTAAERTRLHALAGQDVGRRGALAEVDAVREMIDVEVGMRQQVLQPVEAVEEADEGYQRLVAAAGRAEAKLRANLEAPSFIPSVTPPQAQAASRGHWRWLAAAALLLVGGLLGYVAFGQSGGPALDSRAPGDSVLGSSLKVYPTVHSRIQWVAPTGAKTYEAVIVDSQDQVILRRTDPKLQKESFWDLSAADRTELRAYPQLFLRVVARDGSGNEVARTAGKQPFELK